MGSIKEIDAIVKQTNIDISPEDLEKTKAWLFQLYKELEYPRDITEKVNSIIEKASKGWTNAPENFFDRVRCVVGYRLLSVYYKEKEAGKLDKCLFSTNKTSPPSKNYQQKLEVDYSDVPEVKVSIFGESLFDYLKEEEKVYWKKRESEYRKEFDFNESSDKVLLDEALYLEILLRRSRLNKLTGEYSELASGLKESELIDNHRKVLEKLGLLRVQRIQYDQDIEGNVGELTLLLEEKINEIKELEDKKLLKKTIDRINSKYNIMTLREIEDLIEEQSLLEEVSRLPALNPIPQAVYAKVTQELNKDVKGIEVLDGKKDAGTPDEESGSNNNTERGNITLFA